jgi:hypothetical protein
MKLIARLQNLWKLSEFESGKPTDEYKIPGTEIVTLVKKPAVFIPYQKRTPAEEIISETV